MHSLVGSLPERQTSAPPPPQFEHSSFHMFLLPSHQQSEFSYISFVRGFVGGRRRQQTGLFSALSQQGMGFRLK
jgi:hypothetical protein